MAKSVLVTGASGFIGSHLVEEGFKRGYRLFAGIRKTSSRRYLTDSRIHFLALDYADPDRLAAQLAELHGKGIRFDFIVHNAGVTRQGRRGEFDTVNHIYTRNLVKALQASGMVPGKFLLMSSLAAVGPGDPDTMHPVTDASVPSPVDAYGRSKRAAERYLQEESNIPYLIMRPTGVYGPRETDYLAVYRNVNKGLELYSGSPANRISFVYIDDLTSMVYEALTSGHVNKTWVVSDGCNYSVEEFIQHVKQVLGKKTVRVVVPLTVVRLIAGLLELACLPFGKVPLLNRQKAEIMGRRNWQCDPSGIFMDLGYTPVYVLEKGLMETIRWNREHHRL